VVRAAREELNQASLDMIGARTRADIAALARTDAQRAHQKARDEVDRIKALIKAADQAEAEVRKAQERLNLVYAHTGDTSSREYIRYWDLLEIARIKAEKARIKAIEARAILPQAEAEADLKARDLTVAQADADRTEQERTNAETNLAAKTRARDEKKTANPEAIRSYWKEDRNAGLTPAQNKGIRDISAFLYRNTLFGDPMDQYENGLILDGILDHTPREKLLMFYLITEEKLQGNLKKEDLLASQTYVPNLDAFRPHMFAGWSRLKGVLGRVRGKSLNWDKLSDAAHMAEEMMGEVNKLLRPRIPGVAGSVRPDPEMAVLIQSVVNLGNSLMANPKPSKEDLKAFRIAVQALDDGIESRKENLWDKTEGAADEGNFWLAYVSKPLSMITSLLTEGGKSDSLGGAISGFFAGGFSWLSVPAGTLGSLLSCITFLGGIIDLVRTGRSGAEALEITEQAYKLFNDTLGTLSSIYGSVRGIAGLAGGTWMGSATAVGFAGGAGAVLGGLVMGHAAFSGIRAKVQEGHITDYKENTLANFLPMGAWTQEQLAALDAQKGMLSDIADSSLDSARRRKTAAKFEGTAGLFGTIAGGLVAGGVTAFAAVPFSAAAFVVGIWGAVKNYKLKKASKNDVIDRYIGMDGPNGIYARYEADNTKPGRDFHEQFGTEEEVKDRLRWRAVRLQGFTSEDKMHAFIMQKYAVALYKGAFVTYSHHFRCR
jgi:hypothetical protein